MAGSPKSVTSNLARFINPASVELLSQGLMQDDCLIRSYTNFHVIVDIPRGGPKGREVPEAEADAM